MTIVYIALVVVVLYALGRYCLWQIKRVQRNKACVSEAYRRYLIEHEEPCYPDIDSSQRLETPSRRAAGLPAETGGVVESPKGPGVSDVRKI